ncbi:MAG: hypothetical protein JOY71_28050 [Acetobacteraceae bacterium]|nr:hypothetical protein [Acetobacteraceae bacterium]MBV8525921.1 hypothetical protein [Acetobacteraceae bacterium]
MDPLPGQIKGASPNANLALLGDVLQAPALPFEGKINLNPAQSTPWWPQTIRVPR